jgi:hypothetical protein
MFSSIGTLVPSEEKVQVALEELQDLKGVWSELAKFWEKIEELKERPWLSVQPRKVYLHVVICYLQDYQNNNKFSLYLTFISLFCISL